MYLLVAIVKKRLNLNVSLCTWLQILSVTLFEKIPLIKDCLNTEHSYDIGLFCNQLNLFDF